MISEKSKNQKKENTTDKTEKYTN